jgi:demethylmenaquinone methyltransferase / 2-methoxy-6-polyprenyl-1,4-benzoquinol methylase
VTRPGAVHDRDPQTGRVADAAAHASVVRGMFARISGIYDRMNHLLSLNLDRRWRRRAADRLDPGTTTLLDLCAGTGDLGLACLAAGRAREVLAVDFVPAMLAGMAGKPGADSVSRIAGDGLALPLPAACVDAVVVGFGVRNLADPAAGAREMLRVLRPGGLVLVLDFFRPDPRARGELRGPAPPVRQLLGWAVPLLGRLAARDEEAYAYLPGSMDRFLPAAAYRDLLASCGFTRVFVERLTLGVAHLVGGRRPVA